MERLRGDRCGLATACRPPLRPLRLGARLRPPLMLVALLVLLAGPGVTGVYYGAPGIVAEFFASPGATCFPGNGSSRALDLLLPNITRTDGAIAYQDEFSFDLEQCAFEMGPNGKRFQVCRGADQLRNSFAARWSGYIGVQEGGMYDFELEADDGARFMMGHNHCPGLTCGDREMVQNLRFGDLEPVNDNDLAFAQQCQECASGTMRTCYLSYGGCEPYQLWILEGDGGFNATCGRGVQIVRGSRYLGAGMHPFKVEYFQRGGGARIILRWSGPDTFNRLIPIPGNSFVFPKHQGLAAEWFQLSDLPSNLPPASALGAVPSDARLVRRQDDRMDDNTAGDDGWSKDIEDIGGAVIVRWTGFLRVITGGRYKFRLESDDGSRLVVGGRGMTGEQVVVDNDGVWGQLISAEGFLNMLPGKTPIRIEFLYSPGAPGLYGDTGIPKPPSMQVFYAGPDTNGQELQLSRAFSIFLHPYDNECMSTRWQWGGGLTMHRDCGGNCFDGAESLIGDYICDDGISKSTNFYCSAFEFDNSDCVPRGSNQFTTPRPSNPCLVSCPPGNYLRKDCSQCDIEKDGSCVEEVEHTCVAGPDDPPGHCNYARCCVAKFSRVDYWGEDCVAFGAYDNCTAKMEQILQEMREAPRSLASLAAEPDKQIQAYLMEDCEGSECARITEAFVRDPFTMRLTDERVCEVGEAEDPGLDCYVGPWVPTDPDPLRLCQDSSFQWNFCHNRRTTHGRPFARCCSFLWIDARGLPQCRFEGIEEGTCEKYLRQLKLQLASSPYTAIEDEMVLQDCEDKDGCNDPMNEEFGCPSVVVKIPPQVSHLVEEELDKVALLKGGGVAPADPIPWDIILIPFAGVTLFALTGYIVYKCIKEPEHSLWHSDKAKIIGEDTFVEPSQDLGRDTPAQLEGVNFGVVQPRPPAFQQVLREQRMIKQPRALRMTPALTAGEVVEEAYRAKLEVEAEVAGVDVGTLRLCAEAAGAGSPISPLPREAAENTLAILAPPKPPRRTSVWDEDDEEPFAWGEGSRELDEGEGQLALSNGDPPPHLHKDASAKQVAALLDSPQAYALADAPAGGGRVEEFELALPGAVPDRRRLTRRSASEPPSPQKRVLPAPPLNSAGQVRQAAGMLAYQQGLAMPPTSPGTMTVVDALYGTVTVGTNITPPENVVSSSARPAATARLLRRGVAGPPRVAT